MNRCSDPGEYAISAWRYTEHTHRHWLPNSVLMEDFFEGWLTFPGFTEILDWEPPKESELTMQNFPKPLQVTETVGSGKPNAEPEPAIETQTTVGTNELAASHTSRQRRGHTKSRLGCITCKKRKIKCQETWPSCANCIKRGTECRYPAAIQSVHCRRMAAGSANPRQIVKLSDTPYPFRLDDLRFYHHYLIAAYPCIPYGSDSVWIVEVPRYSYRYSYLMEAMLAIAASHLALRVDKPDVKAALTHRHKAIQGLEEAFTRWPPSAEEAHIMLATSYMLCFQSSYIDDGFEEHLLSLRGCAFLSQLILGESLHGPFEIHVNMHTTLMEHKLNNFPRLDQDVAREALISLKGFSHLIAPLATSSVEKALVAQYVEMIQPLLEMDTTLDPVSSDTPESEPSTASIEGSVFSPSPCPAGHLFIQNPLFDADLVATFEAIDWTTITQPKLRETDPLRSFNALMASLLILANCEHKDLNRLFDRKNQLSNIVMGHFLATRLITSPLSAPPTTMRIAVAAFLQWTVRVLDAVKDDEDGGEKWTKYVTWPRKVLRCMEECVKVKKDLCFGDIYEILLQDPGALKEGRVSAVLQSKDSTVAERH